MPSAIKIENLWKEYRLGVIGHGTLTHDLQSWWARVCRKEDPNAKIGSMSERQVGQIEGERFWALRDISLEVKQGEVLGIIGRNGAGKSTLLKILSRVTAPTRGCVKVKGRIASLLEVGTGFHPELTGRENIFMNGAILGMSRKEIERKLDEIIHFSGVEDFIETPVKRYSSGMYVRLAFAVAAHLEPEILVVDEVLAVGDAQFQKKCLGKMQDVSRQGRTVLLVSHNMGSIQKLCSKSLLLQNGVIEGFGETNSIINQYLSLDRKIVDNFSQIKRKNKIHGNNCRISSACIVDKDGEMVTQLLYGDNLAIKLKCVGVRYSEGLRCIVGINTRYEERITTIMMNTSFNIKEGEEKEFILYIDDLILNPASYFFTVGIRMEEKGEDHLENVSSFEIVDVQNKELQGKEIVNFGIVTHARYRWNSM